MSLSRKILIVILILVILGAAFYLWRSYSGQLSEESQIAEETVSETVDQQPAPQLMESTFSPDLASAPSLPDGQQLTGAWNADESLFLFWEAETEQVKVRKTGEADRLITSLKGILPPLGFSWSPDSRYAMITDGPDLYVIGLELGSRKKIPAGFSARNLLWANDSKQVLLNDSTNKVYQIKVDQPGKLLPLGYSFDLSRAVWAQKDKFLSYETAGNTTRVLLVDAESGVKGTLAEKIDFPVGDLYYDSGTQTGYLQNTDTNTWYEIKIE